MNKGPPRQQRRTHLSLDWPTQFYLKYACPMKLPSQLAAQPPHQPPQNNLCLRCRDLKLDTFVVNKDEVIPGDHATIHKDSLQESCMLCCQFVGAFRALSLLSNGITGDQLDELHLQCRRLESSEAVNTCKEVYFTICDEDWMVSLKLFPTQGKLQVNGGSTGSQHAKIITEAPQATSLCPSASSVPPAKSSSRRLEGPLGRLWGSSILSQRRNQSLPTTPNDAQISEAVGNHRTSQISRIGRLIDPNAPDYGFVKRFLNRCTSKHLSCRRQLPLLDNLQLIDCKTRKIIHAAPNQLYVALSYVWGEAISQMAIGDRLPDDIPKTVEDALTSAISIGIPFLWVDRYCIDQSNAIQKHEVIRNMDRIYHGAEVTIIAIGDSPHDGLPGVRGTPRRAQYQFTAGGKTFVAVEEVDEEIKRSKWNSRGWTFQESVLSRRRLVYTSSQIYIDCLNTFDLEALSPLVLKIPAYFINYRVFPTQLGGLCNSIKELDDHLREYYRRQLSYPVDAVDAFVGIINAMNHSNSFSQRVSHFYGIPVVWSDERPDDIRASFLSNLLWHVLAPKLDLPLSTGIFPTWSWAAAKAERPPMNLGHLGPILDDLEISTSEYKNKQVEVQLCHKSHGPVSISQFPYLANDYKDYMPWIIITTHVLAFSLTKTTPSLSGTFDYNKSTLRDRQLFAVITEGHTGLIVIETEPGLFRRVGTFSTWSEDGVRTEFVPSSGSDWVRRTLQLV